MYVIFWNGRVAEFQVFMHLFVSIDLWFKHKIEQIARFRRKLASRRSVQLNASIEFRSQACQSKCMSTYHMKMFNTEFRNCLSSDSLPHFRCRQRGRHSYFAHKDCEANHLQINVKSTSRGGDDSFRVYQHLTADKGVIAGAKT